MAEHDWIDLVLRDVAELPDRNSPDEMPDMMLVTAAELESIITAHAPTAVPDGFVIAYPGCPTEWVAKPEDLQTK